MPNIYLFHFLLFTLCLLSSPHSSIYFRHASQSNNSCTLFAPASPWFGISQVSPIIYLGNFPMLCDQLLPQGYEVLLCCRNLQFKSKCQSRSIGSICSLIDLGKAPTIHFTVQQSGLGIHSNRLQLRVNHSPLLPKCLARRFLASCPPVSKYICCCQCELFLFVVAGVNPDSSDRRFGKRSESSLSNFNCFVVNMATL